MDWELLNDVGHLKKGLGNTNPSRLSGYSKYLVEALLSLHPDLIFLINEMNVRPQIPVKMHYNYLLHAIPPKKRFAKMKKPQKLKKIKLIKDYYGYNDDHAYEVLDLFSKEDFKRMENELYTGGKQ